ncbi:MAG: LysM peptidoglycan-binding domain-containing protein [Acidimicrobiia bacterium]|nr:LysM peptidoglycan-binding domain-containing protein [Acidimicrobiia bacterium]
MFPTKRVPNEVRPGSRRTRHRAMAFMAIITLVIGVPRAVDSADYTVESGDTLGVVAERYDTSIAALVEANSLVNADHIVVGQVLTVPDAAGMVAARHTVAEGDTLSTIAALHGIAVADLASANDIGDANLIIVGTTLTLPNGAGSTSDSTETHVVVAGETLSIIAARFGITVDDLAAANGIDEPDLVVVGTTLSIGVHVPAAPDPTPTAPEQPTPAPVPTPMPQAVTHTVAPGESLSGIASTFGVTLAELAVANDIGEPDIVTTGTVLVIPIPAPAQTPAPAAAGPVVGSDVAPLIDKWATEYGVSPELMKALMWFESGWNNDLVSATGAIGVGQLMPATVEFASTQLLGEPIDPHDVGDNVRASIRLMRFLLDNTNDDWRLALAAYYQGLSSVQRDGIYDSSMFYIEGILALTSRF